MKNVFFTILLVTFSSALWSQTEKGTHFLGSTAILVGQSGTGLPGSAGFAFGTSSHKVKVGDFSTTTKEKITTFNFSPSYGYFLANGFVAGVSVGFLSSGSKDEDDNTFDYSSFSAGPFLRYYIASGKKVQPFAEVRGGVLSSRFKNNYADSDDFDYDDKSIGSYVGGRLGAAIFLGAKTSLDIYADYSTQTIKGEEASDGVLLKVTDKNSLFGLGIGFTFLL